MKSSGIGGQAVLEGIMMKNGDQYAVAVRKPDQEIEVKKEEYKGFLSKHPAFNVPVVRGVFAFVDSLVLGVGTLNYSASFYDEEGEEEKTSRVEEFLNQKISKKTQEKAMTVFTVALSVILCVGIFMVVPVWLVQFLAAYIPSQTVLALIEGLVRIGIFILYVVLISRLNDIKRVFMYHGAEHKCINCIEHGLDLTVENVKKSSREHKRCGTSFLLIVMVISVIFFVFIRVDALWLRMVSRVLLVPVIAGVSYEFLKLAGRSDSKVVDLLSRPGLWLQGLTTREPDEDMIQVAIQAVEAVFDWRAYQAENFPQASEAKQEAGQEQAAEAEKETGAEKEAGVESES